MNCAICLEPLTGDVYGLKNCRHTFHTRCILSWWEVGSDTCPCCRKTMKVEDYDIYDKCDQLRGVLSRDNEEYNKFVGELNRLCDIRDSLIDKYYEIEVPLKEEIFKRYGVFDDLTESDQAEFTKLHSHELNQMSLIRVRLEELDTKIRERRENLRCIPYILIRSQSTQKVA